VINDSKEPLFPIIQIKKSQTPRSDKNRFARPVYDHKTAGEINIMTREQFNDFKSYEPGRYGRSSVKTRSKSSSGSSGGLSGI